MCNPGIRNTIGMAIKIFNVRWIFAKFPGQENSMISINILASQCSLVLHHIGIIMGICFDGDVFSAVSAEDSGGRICG
jgi:hypothetical protein